MQYVAYSSICPKACLGVVDFFIKEPKAITDPSLKIFVDFFKEKIAQEQESLAKGLGTQKMLANELV